MGWIWTWISDVIVSCNLLHCLSKLFAIISAFTECLPHAEYPWTSHTGLLHQLIKGAFKDHVSNHFKAEHPAQELIKVLDDIDNGFFFFFSLTDCAWSDAKYSIALALSFSGLWTFPEGRGFKHGPVMIQRHYEGLTWYFTLNLIWYSWIWSTGLSLALKVVFLRGW